MSGVARLLPADTQYATPEGFTLVGWADTTHLDQGMRDESTT
jgi:hypothetical protein